MPDPHWENLKEIFHAALALAPEARHAYLDRACDGDASLRQAVESLLKSHEGGNVLDTPVYQAAAQIISHKRTFESGEMAAHYQIVSLLGEGGMGKVYLAEDIKLQRRVSLKFLSDSFTGNSSNMHRFEQEARAASALNHPNILTIHEIAESDGHRFIVSEFIEGETLRERMATGALSIGEALNIAEQVAFGLVAAHHKGIIHRDIKPENLMLRRDGIVKILDFGLAKLSAPNHDENFDQSGPANTTGGLVMGTVTYMSPEQIRGLPIDPRTDIWSLGIVIYEMIVGRTPFSGALKPDVIVSVLHDDPPPLSLGSQATSKAFEHFTNKALNKDREARYQTATEVLSALRELKQELRSGLELRHTHANVFIETQSADYHKQASQKPVNSTAATKRFSTLINARSRLRNAVLAAAVLLVFLTGLALTVYRFTPGRLAAIKHFPFAKISLTSLTNTGRITDPVISHDGKYIAYVEEDGGRRKILLRQVSAGGYVQIVPPTNVFYYGLTFSKDGEHVYYIAKEHNNSIGTLYEVPVLGGPARRVIADVDGPVSISPDGKQLTFVRGSSTGVRALMLANIDGTQEKTIAARRGIDSFSYGGPSWSPDGKTIACGAGSADATGRYMTIVTVAIADGTVKELSPQRWGNIGQVTWTPDGSGVIFTAKDLAKQSTSQLWYLSNPEGQAQRITNDLDDYNGVSLAADGSSLVTAQTQTIASLWVTPDGSLSRATQISSGKHEGFEGTFNRFVWTTDDRILFSSEAKGKLGIFVMNADGSNVRQLTADPGFNTAPSLSPDGKLIAFVSDRNGPKQVWRMEIDGSNQRQLTSGPDDTWPQFSADGHWVIYQSNINGQRTIWRVPATGGEPVQITLKPSACPVLSPDGRFISCYYRTDTKAPWKWAIISITGGEPVKLVDVPATVVLLSPMRWMPDGRALAYIDNRQGVSNIWSLPLDGSRSVPLTNFTRERIFWFDWSRDGSLLGLTRGTVASDAVMINAVQ